jgi:hypothetical protein
VKNEKKKMVRIIKKETWFVTILIVLFFTSFV